MTHNSLSATLYALALGLFGVGALIALTEPSALYANALPLAFFAVLSFIVKRAGFHVAPQVTHSLVGVVDLAAVFIFGPILGAWVAATSGFFYLFLNALRHEQHTFRNLFEIPFFNAGLKIGMAYASTHLYLLLGGKFVPREFTPQMIPSLLAALLAWFAVDHIGWGLLEFLRGGAQALTNFLRSIIFYSILMELLPLPFAIVIAVVYSSLDVGVFLIMALGLVGTAIVVQRFADASAHLERRRNELTVLNEFGQALSQAGFDSEKVIDLLHQHARRVVPADLYRIELFDRERAPEAGSLLVLEATERETRRLHQTRPSLPLLEYFSAQRDPLRVSDLAKQSPLQFDQIQIDGGAPRSALIVPMFAGDDLIGALSLFSARPRAFFPIHARNLASMGAQVAVTIQNARLYAVERKRAAQLGTVSEVSRQVAAFLDLDELLQKVVTQIRERFGYAHVHIFTVDTDAGYVVFRASTHPRGVEWRARGIGYRIGLEGIVGWVAAMGEPQIVNDVSKEPRFLPYPDKVVDETRSEIVVPLAVGGQVIGVLDVESNQLNAFNKEDLFILRTLAAQVAIAIEDARLYKAQKEEAYYLNVLLQVAENLSATTDLDEALETIVRITPLLVGVARCAVFLYHAPERIFVPAKAYGLSNELKESFGRLHFQSDDQFAFAKMWREQTPVVIEDAASSQLLPADWVRRLDIQSLLLAPLVVRGKVVGAMLVDQGARPRHFSKHEIDVVMGIANQAAIAIEGARLRREAEEKKRFEVELGLARQIQKSFLPEACPVLPGYQICSLWQTAREVSGDFYDFVSLSGGRLAITIADVSDKGMAAALFMALSRTILRTMAIGKPTPHETVERANDVILADARSEMFVTVFYAVLDPPSGQITYVNAGHNPPLLYRAARQELTTLKGHGMALGVTPNLTFEEHTIELARGDILLLYTDGVTDAINMQEEEFGAERLAALVMSNAHLNADALIDEIARALADFAGEGVRFDDVTMVVVKRA
jgi:serine phosphatase RsbU (regulator of sigma subunit)/putative methionine-R-sulfoxide reductase with GAF domain